MYCPQKTINYSGTGTSTVYSVEFSTNFDDTKMTIKFNADQEKGITKSLSNAKIPFTAEGINRISIQSSFKTTNIHNSLNILAQDGFINYDYAQEITSYIDQHRLEDSVEYPADKSIQLLMPKVISLINTFFGEKNLLDAETKQTEDLYSQIMLSIEETEDPYSQIMR